jgi:hypothetical protein
MLPSNGCCCNFTNMDMIWQLGRKIVGLQLGEMDVDWGIAFVTICFTPPAYSWASTCQSNDPNGWYS